MIFSVLTRTGSEGSRLLREWASWRREPQIPEGLVSSVWYSGSREGISARWKIRTVVLCVVIGILDRISPTDGGGVMVCIAFVGGEVDFFE